MTLDDYSCQLLIYDNVILGQWGKRCVSLTSNLVEDCRIILFTGLAEREMCLFEFSVYREKNVH